MVDATPKSIFQETNFFFLLPMMDGSPRYLLVPIVSMTPRREEMNCFMLGGVLELNMIFDF